MPLEQENTVSMNDVGQKLIKPGNLLMISFPGIFYVLNASINLPQLRGYIGLREDLSCVTEAMSQLILKYALFF